MKSRIQRFRDWRCAKGFHVGDIYVDLLLRLTETQCYNCYKTVYTPFWRI